MLRSFSVFFFDMVYRVMKQPHLAFFCEQPHPTSPDREECKILVDAVLCQEERLAIQQPHLAPIGAYLPYQGGTSSPVRGNATKWKGVDYIAYNRSLIDYSRENRNTPTRAE